MYMCVYVYVYVYIHTVRIVYREGYVPDSVVRRSIGRRPRNTHARKDVIPLKVMHETSHRTRYRVVRDPQHAWTVLTSPLNVTTRTRGPPESTRQERPL